MDVLSPGYWFSLNLSQEMRYRVNDLLEQFAETQKRIEVARGVIARMRRRWSMSLNDAEQEHCINLIEEGHEHVLFLFAYANDIYHNLSRLHEDISKNMPSAFDKLPVPQ